ncbi:MAG: HIT family protein [Hyphococcus sp.]
MSLITPYDADNIFAKIIRGDMPSTKIYEDNDVLAFMDVFPQSEGHCLVIHKQATATNLLDIDPQKLGVLIAAVQKVAGAVVSGLKPDGVRVAQFNGAPAGQTVYHLHFHIIPVYEGEAIGRHASGGPVDADALEPTAEKIRAAL